MRELDIGSDFAGHRIEALVGRGGMALVYRATQLELNRPVALKLIAPQLAQDREFRTRFKRESHIAASIDHPNVVPIFHAGEAEGQLYITMRFVDGTDLRELAADRNLASVERYDPAADRWTQLPPLPTPRGGLGAAIVGRRLVAVGGEGPTSVFATAESFDLGSGRWSRMPELRTARHGMGIAAIGSTVYALGGALEPGHLTSSTVAESIAFKPSQQP